VLQGTRKPAPAAYERVLAHASCDPQDLLFVDDRPVNTQGAEAAGIPSILFKGAQDLEEQLRSRGLEF
jgi:putative hydrolase of the HAD superfamily